MEVPRWLLSSDMVNFLTSTLYLSSEGNFISFFVGCPRIFSYPQIGYWAWPFLTLFVYMRLDTGPGLLQCSLNTWYNWSLQMLFIIQSINLFFMHNLSMKDIVRKCNLIMNLSKFIYNKKI